MMSPNERPGCRIVSANGYRLTTTRSMSPPAPTDSTWAGSSRRARMPAWTLGWSVFTRPSSCSAMPAKVSTVVTRRPAFARNSAVPPEAMSSTPRAESSLANVSNPVLSEQLRRARLTVTIALPLHERAKSHEQTLAHGPRFAGAYAPAVNGGHRQHLFEGARQKGFLCVIDLVARQWQLPQRNAQRGGQLTQDVPRDPGQEAQPAWRGHNRVLADNPEIAGRAFGYVAQRVHPQRFIRPAQLRVRHRHDAGQARRVLRLVVDRTDRKLARRHNDQADAAAVGRGRREDGRPHHNARDRAG